jgi:geranylgeranyl diphosphate synthase type II
MAVMTMPGMVVQHAAQAFDPSHPVIASASRERLLGYHRRHAGGIARGLREAVASNDPLLHRATTYFLGSEGKYVRPLLTLLACEVTGGDPGDALELACAIELAHASSLILDDLPCMDGAEMRRGQPCLHRHFGEAVAILTALHLLATAFSLAARADDSGRAAVVLARAIGAEGLIGGQLRDLAGDGHLDAVRERKTSPLLCAAAHFGALAAHADRTQQDAVVRYAGHLGLAFQLRDDVLDREAAAQAQRRANDLAGEASTTIYEAFGRTPAALSLDALAQFAITRAN